MLGHELRRPLTVIRGASTLLVDDADALPPASRQQLLRLIDRGAGQMADLIDDLLAAVHLDLGDVQYLPVALGLGTVISEAVEAAQRVDGDHPIEVSAHGDLVADVDREYAVQALRAVLVNALQNAPAGTAVEVRVEARPDAVRVEVLDRGPGVPEGSRERVFGKFSKLDEQAGGAGLGLYVARGLARGMGGDLTLDEREGGGACLCFTLKRRG